MYTTIPALCRSRSPLPAVSSVRVDILATDICPGKIPVEVQPSAQIVDMGLILCAAHVEKNTAEERRGTRDEGRGTGTYSRIVCRSWYAIDHARSGGRTFVPIRAMFGGRSLFLYVTTRASRMFTNHTRPV